VPLALGEVGENTAGIFLALSAGSFIYIAATDLIPAASSGRELGKRFHISLCLSWGHTIGCISKYSASCI